MLLTFILQTVSAKKNLEKNKSESGQLKPQVSERRLGLSKKIKSDIGPSMRELPATYVNRASLFGPSLTGKVNQLYAKLDKITDSVEKEMRKIEGIEEITNDLLLSMDKTAESAVTKELTFTDICQTELITNMQDTTRKIVVNYFDQSSEYMAFNAYQLKVEIYFLWAEVTRYTDVLKKYTNVVLKSYLERYFTIRMKGMSAFLGVLFNFQVEKSDFAGTTIYNFDRYYKSVQKMSYTKIGIALEYDNLFYFLDKWRGDKIFYQAADEVVDPSKKDIYGETIKDKADVFTTKMVFDTLQLVCDTTVTLMNLYFTHASKEVFIKATQTNEASYDYMVEYIINYSDMFTGIYDGGKEVVEGRRFEKCKDLSEPKVVYQRFASYLSMKIFNVDITDSVVFKARAFFSRDAMYFFYDKALTSKKQYYCDLVLLYPENNGFTENALNCIDTSKQCAAILPDIDFLSDFSVILGWNAEWKERYTFESFLETGICVDQISGELIATQKNPICANADIHQAYYLVLKNIYNGYNVVRALKWLKDINSKTPNKIQAIYKLILQLFIKAGAFTAAVEKGWVSIDEMQRVYVDIVYYLCEKSGGYCDTLKDEQWEVVKNYIVTFKIKTTRTITTITKVIKIFEDKLTIIKSTVKKSEILKLIVQYQFKYVKKECRNSLIDLKNPNCKDIKTNYSEFTKILIQIFSLKVLGDVMEVIRFIINFKGCSITGDEGAYQSCKQTIVWYLWTYLIDTTIKDKPAIVKQVIWAIYFEFDVYFTDYINGPVDPETGKVVLKDETIDGMMVLEFLMKLFNNDQINSVTKQSNKRIKFTQEDLILIEQVLFYVVYKPWLDGGKEDMLKKYSPVIALIIRNMYLHLNPGSAKVPEKTFFDTWKQRMSMDMENIALPVWNPVLEQDTKKSTSVYEMIMIKMRLISYLQAGQFFIFFPAASSFKSTELKPYANPFTVVFNYFSMIRKEIDEGEVFSTEFNAIFYRKVKECLKKTSAGAAVGTDECNGYSHRKFEEIFFFVQALYLQNVPTSDLKKKDLPKLTTYYDETKPIVHSKIFMSMYFGEKDSDLMKEIADICEVQKITSGKDKKLVFAKLDRLCVDLHIYNIVYDHIKSTDIAGLNQGSFLTRLLSVLEAPFSEDDITKLKFALLNTGEIMAYISIGTAHLDRYYLLFDMSRVDKENQSLRKLGDKPLDKLTKKEVEIFGNYLYRMFGKFDYSITEEPTAMAVQALLASSVPEFKEYLTYSTGTNYNQFKTVLLFASPTQYAKIAEMLSSDDKFLQVVLMNNFQEDRKDEKILMYVKSLDTKSFLVVNEYTLDALQKREGYTDFYTKSIGAATIKTNIEKYKSQLRRVFYDNNKKVEQKIDVQRKAFLGEDLDHGPGKISDDEIKKRVAKNLIIEKGNIKRKDIVEKQTIETSITVTKQPKTTKRVITVQVEVTGDENGDFAGNIDDFTKSLQGDVELALQDRKIKFTEVNVQFPVSSIKENLSNHASVEGGIHFIRKTKSVTLRSNSLVTNLKRSSSLKESIQKNPSFVTSYIGL